MPRFSEILKGMQAHLSGTISGAVGIVPTPDMPLGTEATPYATVAPGTLGSPIGTQAAQLGRSGQLSEGQLLITGWVKPYRETAEETTLVLLEDMRLLKNRAVTADVGSHINVLQTDAPVSVDDDDGILIRQTATIRLFYRED